MSGKRCIATSVAAIAVLVVSAGIAGCRSAPQPDAFETPFASSSPWRQVIGPNPSIDPASAEMIAYVQAKPGVFANLVEFGVPIYRAGSNTPTYTVECTERNFGLCPFAGWPVPIPDSARANTGTDGVLVTVDESSGNVFEFWQAAKDGEKWTTAFGAVNSIRGSGWGGAATGAGASRLAGVIRISEIEKGEIPHALALQTGNACPTFRAPAQKSDGTSERADCIPEGSLLQLDPSLDLSTLGLGKGAMAVATAMQRYGGYVMDVAGTTMSASFELDTEAAPGSLGKVYQDAGFRWDYDAMEQVPWQKLRVLN